MAEFEREKSQSYKKLVIWDCDDTPPQNDSLVILWSSYIESTAINCISIPQLVDDNSLFFRNKYLSWIYNLGESKINGKRLIDHLEIEKGFSYWWMTWLSHKPNFYESQQINDVVKCFAFENLITNTLGIDHIEIVSRNRRLKSLFYQFCSLKNIQLRWAGLPVLKENKKQSFFLKIPSLRVKALLYFVSVFLKYIIHFKKSDKKWYEEVNSSIVFFDMLVYLPEKVRLEGKFYSDYWNKLPQVIDQLKIPTLWIHALSLRSKKIIKQTSSFQIADTPREAQKLMNIISKAEQSNSKHVLIDTMLGFSSMYKVLACYVRLNFLLFTLKSVKNHFMPINSGFDFWHIYEENWRESLIGYNAVKNCLHLHAYIDGLKKIPHQSMGLFIKENQPWEMALLYAWKLAGHGTIIGVPHTTVRFWDLRYFYDHRNYTDTYTNALPLVDILALNGPAAINMYKQGGFPENKIIEVEALRYLHLLKVAPKRVSKAGATHRVLICGDNIPGSNEKLMRIIKNSAENLNNVIDYIFKPHKDSKFNVELYNFPKFSLSNDSLTKLIDQSDLVITGNITSAAVDAYCRGAQVATMLDGAQFNSSPLKNNNRINFFSNSSQLTDIILKIKDDLLFVEQDFFLLDESIPKWLKLLTRENK
jgi:surface carbohydrate biosynthesis protein (TIGR04326 family)